MSASQGDDSGTSCVPKATEVIAGASPEVLGGAEQQAFPPIPLGELRSYQPSSGDGNPREAGLSP